MSIRHLDALFSPASVAVIGASMRPTSVGGTVWRNLNNGGFKGLLYAVNPKHAEIGGVKTHASVADLPAAPELAILCTPADTVVALIAELGARGTRAAIVLTAGLNASQKQAMLDAARVHTLRILGPNCIGMLVPHLGLNASFAHTGALPGELAFVSQSGALVTALLDWAGSRGIGFSHFVSLGERADVDFGDMLDFLGSDPKTRAILLYIESIEEPRKFMSAARAAARNKPVIVVKAGRSTAGQQAAASHTGALAGSDGVFDAAIARAGMLRVNTLQDLFLAAETLSRFHGNRADQLIVLTNGGGAGVMAADAAATEGVPLAALSPSLRAQLNAVLPANWSHANPVDIIGDAPATRYVQALEALAQDTASAVLFIHAPTAIVPSLDIAQALLPLARAAPKRVLGCWLGDGAVAQARELFRAAGVPDFNTPEDAVRAFSLLRTFREHQAELLQTPPARASAQEPDLPRIRTIVDSVLASGRELLTEPEAKDLLEAAGLPVVATRVVGPSAPAAQAAADALGYPVALKILSFDISHKSDVGGVRLNLGSAAEVGEACATMLARVREQRPDAKVEGFTVQTMVRKKHAHELIVGASVDPVFGPTVLFGQGGVAVEVLADTALALPPLNTTLALAQIARTRVARLLRGYRDEPAADIDAIAQVLVSVSQLLADVPELAELDINPLLANHEGAVALDARVRVSARRPAGAVNFAIQPYPQDLVESWDWQGQPVTLRPIRPEDEAQHLAFLEKLDPEDIRLRVFYSRRHIEHSELARLTQIDYAREMAFIATRVGADGVEETLGAVRAVVDPDNVGAEFGVIVRSDLKGSGLGHKLMCKLIEHLRARGTQRIFGTVLRINRGMLELARSLGFQETTNPSDPGDVETRFVALDLQTTVGQPP
ncbi:bifunctional acetate--CoA ligase family protein/GNAT family N-acetyltransferase [Hydrogenophaga sp. PBL-H3]|uniref:bifunctional acetate--CoA ligase family protein/GNAT family N-acetyltransferase n=1 Tax=Hydrogenophaga sp. PBL-H3 TaxID=434010 RepID=UPI00131FC9CA|nr:bifunctional acetate--CoA ligase family protein/GNAT family N-acetyltransferase [Hydrogenophaga sp. PBL-H3]QHE78007.1 bifunctional acetate--CoA ligase family protein/GNAT family N-acetyltransferase [Hydrogenophaga sp. PBL-H3]QHE82431.1 bifunctional acetate--CoA ligase family protein/GNAT family N-acetyltransferase [Hydrogenophaga sp. PBL-H3]